VGSIIDMNDSLYKRHNDGMRDGTKYDKKYKHLRDILKREVAKIVWEFEENQEKESDDS